MEEVTRRSALREVRENAEVFAPRREIPRTPPRAVKPLLTAARSETPLPVGGSRAPANDDGGGLENVPPDWATPHYQKKVQAACFTPKRSLARSPPPVTQPPPSPPTASPEAPTTQPTSPPHHNSPQQSSQFQSRLSQIHPKPAQKQPLPSPPITKRAVTLPQGLVCTENDLAFLQHMETAKQHQQLQSDLEELEKAVMAASQEKEQLHLTAEKIGTDLTHMRKKYVATLSSANSLQSNTDQSSAHSNDVTVNEPMSAGLGQTHLSRLQHMRRLMEVQLGKTERDIQRKASVVSQDRETLESRRVKERMTVEELQKEFENVQMEKREWETRVKMTLEAKLDMEKELESLNSQLKPLQSAPPHSKLAPPTPSTTEIAAAEERLRRLARRCDLYVRRHRLLKQQREQI